MIKALVIGCSLNASSNSQILAREAAGALQALGAQVSGIDLREHELELFGASQGDRGVVAPLADAVADADVILLCTPIYNYDVNAAAKNFVEHTGSSWEDKIVGFLCSAGGNSSYMAVMSLANSLMLDFRCLIIPRFVYATGEAFKGASLVSEQVRERIAQLCRQGMQLAGATARRE